MRLLRHTYLMAVWRRITGLKSMPTGLEMLLLLRDRRIIVTELAVYTR